MTHISGTVIVGPEDVDFRPVGSNSDPKCPIPSYLRKGTSGDECCCANMCCWSHCRSPNAAWQKAAFESFRPPHSCLGGITGANWVYKFNQANPESSYYQAHLSVGRFKCLNSACISELSVLRARCL